MKPYKALLVLSAVLVTMLLSGCAALLVGGAAGAGGAVYVKGKLSEDVNATASQVHDATVSALKELNLPIIEDTHDNLSAKMKSRFADGAEVWIDISSLSTESSQITVRVGVLGDENRSRQILDAVHKHLPMGTGKS